MIFERQNLLDHIIELLSFLKSKVELSNPINLTDVNVISENFYRDFLNLLLGYDLINININEQNAAAIDLGDEAKKIAIQVTATSDLKKTRDTVAAFIKKKYYNTYDRLIILNITARTNHRDEFVGEAGKYQLNTDTDIWDFTTLVTKINNLTTPELETLCNFLKSEIRLNINQVLSKEVRTFIVLIEKLSDESQPSAGNGFLEAPDPEGKITIRFANYATFLLKEFQDLYTEYGQVLEDVMKQSDLGNTRIRRLGLHLKVTSDDTLTQCNGDAKQALDLLVQKYSDTLAENGIEYDTSAIRFFLVQQLIKCNVFPNKVSNS